MSLYWISTLCAAASLVSASTYAETTSKPAEQDQCKSCSPMAFSKMFTTLSKEAIPSVVFIKATGSDSAADSQLRGRSDPFSDDFFQQFFGAPRGPQQPPPQASQGSGFFISADGHIMTNAHVVAGTNKITVSFDNGKELDATLVGADPHTDIAILKVEGENFPFLNLGNSDDIEVGEWVAAVGSPFQLEASITAGIISAKGRQNLQITDLEDFIQTDAAINPGNSGGPLLCLNGDVIGVNTAIVSRSGGYMGIGFAVPSNMAIKIKDQIIEKGSVTRGFLGVSLQPVDQDIAAAFQLEKAEGALVSEVVKGSPADQAGIKQGDIIVEYNGAPIKSLGGFRNEVSLAPPGSVIQLKIIRKGKIVSVKVPLGTSSDSLSTSGATMQQLGIEVGALTPDLRRQLDYSKSEEGVVITRVKPGSPAAMAGLRPGFLILAVNHKKATTLTEFDEAARSSDKNNRVLLLVKHGNLTRFYSIRLP